MSILLLPFLGTCSTTARSQVIILLSLRPLPVGDHRNPADLPAALASGTHRVFGFRLFPLQFSFCSQAWSLPTCTTCFRCTAPRCVLQRNWRMPVFPAPRCEVALRSTSRRKLAPGAMSTTRACMSPPNAYHPVPQPAAIMRDGVNCANPFEQYLPPCTSAMSSRLTRHLAWLQPALRHNPIPHGCHLLDIAFLRARLSPQTLPHTYPESCQTRTSPLKVQPMNVRL